MITNTNTADTEQPQQQTPDSRLRQAHVGCVVCDPANPHGLDLCCEPDGEGRVSANFKPQPWMVGFSNQMHGGIVSTLLDGAMTQCLFAHDKPAMTAVMHTRFRRPVPLDRQLHVIAWIERGDGRRKQLRAELREDGQLLAEAEALFIPRPGAGLNDQAGQFT